MPFSANAGSYDLSSTERVSDCRPLPGEDAVQVSPARCLAGTVSVPGDKSVSHRLAMLGGLANGVTTLRNFLASEDCLSTLAAVGALGADTVREGTAITIRGVGGRFEAPRQTLDLGNSGTGMRLMAGLLAAHPFCSEMSGDASLCSRPMRRVQVPLQEMGAKVEALGADGRPPLRITGGGLCGIEYSLPVASAQVKSCVLLAGLFASGQTTVIEPGPCRDHTELLLSAMGVDLAIDGASIAITGSGGEPVPLAGRAWDIAGDFSSAAFWIAAAACRDGSTITIEDVGLNPRRTGLLDVLREMGGEIRCQVSGVRCQWEERGTVTVQGTKLRGTSVGGDRIPNLIDELPLVAVAGALAEGETEIRDAAELRVKESDRIAVMVEGMKSLGVDVEERPDGMLIRGGRSIRGGATVDSRGDHRVAMALAVLALFADGPTTVRGVQCIRTSYPTFWDDWSRLAGASA